MMSCVVLRCVGMCDDVLYCGVGWCVVVCCGVVCRGALS